MTSQAAIFMSFKAVQGIEICLRCTQGQGENRHTCAIVLIISSQYNYNAVRSTIVSTNNKDSHSNQLNCRPSNHNSEILSYLLQIIIFPVK